MLMKEGGKTLEVAVTWRRRKALSTVRYSFEPSAAAHLSYISETIGLPVPLV